MAKGPKTLFIIRFKIEGTKKTFRTTACSPEEAVGKLSSKGRILSVRKASKKD